MSQQYSLSEKMTQFVHWSSTFVGADDHIDSVRAAYEALSRNYTPLRDGSVLIRDEAFTANGIEIAIRIYQPLGEAPKQGWPAVLYLHGGGWVMGGLNSHEFVTAPLARDLNAVVIAVDYRMAPEAIFPAAFDDCLSAWQYVQEQSGRLKIQADNIVIAGDSAGGNLAAALVQALADAVVKPKGQALIYPSLTMDFNLPSHQEHAHAPLLTTAEMVGYRDTYAPDPSTHNDIRISPLAAADFSGVPPTFVGIAEYDPLSDDGRVYVEKLQAAGVNAELHVGQGLLHSCLRMLRDCAETDRLYQQMVLAIKKMHQPV